jgi:sialic acid synthase SpsE/sugar phosphate isomerase/epimerase
MKIQIERFEIGDTRSFIIAEIGNNHNGDFERAKLMIDKAVEMGADCAKFQMRQMKEVYRSRSLEKSGEDLGTEYIIDLLNRFELSVDQQKQLADYCSQKGILYLCTPWDITSVDILESFGVAAYKVASADLTNLPLLDRLAKTKKPLILSTGMSTTDEVKFTVAFLTERKVQFVLLHCNSTYPAPLHDINLKWMKSIEAIHPLVGYSGHERGIAVSMAAVALGAKVLERHFTLDRMMEGPDHAASLEFNEFKEMISGIREIESALGCAESRSLSQGEMINRENLGKSLVASIELKKGTVLKSEHIKVLSPGQGLSPQNYEKLLGREIKRDMLIEDFFFSSDIDDDRHKPRDYKFKHRWGVPVRYHDFKKYHELVRPDLYEFHLSYSDMDLNPADFLEGVYDCGFVVHAPELFQGSHLMDLATPDEEYRKYSIQQTQRVIDIARALKKYFPKENRPQIVANIGGFSMDAPFAEETKIAYYDQFFTSLSTLDTEGVEITPQTMAPFPWHFGGQRYQNIFVHVDEIVKYCKQYNLRMCFDVSHSMLTCNYFKQDFYAFAEKIAPYTAHLHLGDAKGLNGEGLQVGDGEMDFKRLGKILNEGCPNATFIPEIWQGHKNDGEGFWIALEKLEGIL